MNKIFIALTVISVLEVHMAFQPKNIVQVSEVDQVVINEYHSACVRKTIKLSGEFYTCKDLKKYLAKRGYEE